MGRTRRKNLLKERVDRFLYHVHGVPPVFCEDFRHADRGSWDTDGHRVTKNGDPTPAKALGDHDGRAVEFDGEPDRFDIEDDPSLNFGPNESGSILFYGAAEIAGDRLLAKQNNARDTGFELYRSGSDNLNFILEDGTNSVTLSGQTIGSEPNNFVVSLDRNSDIGIAFKNGDPTTGTTDISSVGDMTVPDPLRVGVRGDLSSFSYLDGAAQLAAIHPQWITEQQAAYLDALLRNRTVDVPDLPVYGTRETGYKRRLPSYLTDAFGADGPDFWWAADRHYHHNPSTDPAVTQLPDFSGSDFAVQRTGNAKANANGSGGFGDPLDYLDFGGDDKYEPPTEIDLAQGYFVAFVTDNVGAAGNDYFVGRLNGNTAINFRTEANDATSIEGQINDASGAGSTIQLAGLDLPNRKTVIAMRYDGAGNVDLWKEDGTRGNTTGTFSPGTFDIISAGTGRYMAANSAVASPTLDLFEMVEHNGAPTDTQVSDFLDAAAQKHGIS